MQISSYELAHCANYMVNELKKIRDKINFYGNEEVKKRQGSNFSLEIPEQDDIFLIKIERVLSEKENITIDSDAVKSLQEKYKEAPNKFKEFDELCDSIHSSTNGSFDQAFFYVPFSRWFEETYILIRDLYLQFLDRLEIKDITQTSHTGNPREALQNIEKTATKCLRPHILRLSGNTGGVS